MIKIMTKDGISLDLAPDAEFVIEYNNPMMEDDRIPVPFSTSIALLPSATNCKVLRYLPALKLEPTVKKLAVSFVFNGIPFLTGTLIYDGIEDGSLNYTFSGRDLEDEWGRKIYEFSLARLSSRPVNDANICWPLMVNKDETGYYVKDCDNIDKSDTYNNQRKYVDSDVKYHNNDYGEKIKRTPAIYAKFITNEAMLEMDDDIYSVYQYVAVVGNAYANPTKVGVFPAIKYNYAECLPDVTVVEFVGEVGKMFCASVYEDGGTFVMKSFARISAENAALDWTSRLADEFSSDKEEAAGYVFGYENSGEDTVNVGDGVVKGLEQSKSPLFAMAMWIAGQPTSLGIIPYLVGATGDIISSEVWAANSADGKKVVAAADVAFQNNLKMENVIDDSDSVDNSCSFNLVKTVPSLLTGKTSSGSIVQRCSMAAIVEPINKEAERRADVYIGLINNGQMTDSGHAISSSVIDITKESAGEDEDLPLIPEGSTEPISLRPDWLYEHFHKRYAQWLATDRQVISCDVNLNEFDLLSFRMYNKVRLHGRDFFVKKLSVTLRAGSEALECSADFISA